MKKKLLIIGHARHGKDTVAEMIRDTYGYNFKSSSEASLDIFLYDVLNKKYKMNYLTRGQAFRDRVNFRKIWHDEICEYNKDDKARLAKDIMSKNNIYVGMRSSVEIQACIDQGVFDLIIGVYDPRKALEETDSFDISVFEESDIVLINSGTLDDLLRNVKMLKL